MKISLCMIVKNEEAVLETCLKNIAPYIDEIIIIDTGSTDCTREIALRYTDKVYDFTWNDDFSAARNFSIEKATNEYILILDSDEIVEQIELDTIKKRILHNPNKIGRLLRINEFGRKDNNYKYNERVNRLFSKKYYRYEGRIHEQLVPFEDRTAEETQNTYLIPLTIRHSGYEGNLSERRMKTQRNINLLKLSLEQNPEDPYLIYQLGKSYYMEENYTTACDYFGRALYFDLNPKLEYVQDLVESYGYSLLNSEQYTEALQLLNVYEEFAHTADFIFLAALILMNNGKFKEAITEFLKASSHSEAKMEGVNSYLAYYNIGVIYECLSDVVSARKYYEKCGDYKLAKTRLVQLG